MTALSESFYLMSIHNVFSWLISTFLLFSRIGKPILDTPHERHEAFEVKQVREVAEHILSGFDYRYKSSWPLASSKSTMPAPPVKTEISEVLNAITMMGKNLQMAMNTQMTSRTGPQTFQMD